MYCPQVVLEFSIMLSGSKGFFCDIFFVRAVAVWLNYYCVYFGRTLLLEPKRRFYFKVFSDVTNIRYTTYLNANTQEAKT